MAYVCAWPKRGTRASPPFSQCIHADTLADVEGALWNARCVHLILLAAKGDPQPLISDTVGVALATGLVSIMTAVLTVWLTNRRAMISMPHTRLLTSNLRATGNLRTLSQVRTGGNGWR